jgi:integrating conjugative element protein (TIGR03752 family)
MKSNGLLKWLMVPIFLLLMIVLIKLLPTHKSASGPKSQESQLSADEMKALGLEGDTPSDTVATLVAQVRQLRTELKNAQEHNERGDPESTRQFEESLNQRIELALEQERRRLKTEQGDSPNAAETRTLLHDLQQRLDSLSQRDTHSDIPLGFGLEDVDGQRFGNGIRWIEPDDAAPKDADGCGRLNCLTHRTRLRPPLRHANLYRASQRHPDGLCGDDSTDWAGPHRRHGQ